MEQANFVIIDHKKYPDCIRITIKNYLRCPLNLLDIFSRKLFCGAIRPFLEAAGLITGGICRLGPFCYVIVIRGGEGGEVVTPSPGKLGTQQNCRPRQSHAEMFKCISYFNPLSIDTEWNCKAQGIGWTFKQIGHKGIKSDLFSDYVESLSSHCFF